MTLRNFIVQQSTLPIGNTVRDHILNPKEGDGMGQVIERIQGLIVKNNIRGHLSEATLTSEIDNNIIRGEIIRNEVEVTEKGEEVNGFISN